MVISNYLGFVRSDDGQQIVLLKKITARGVTATQRRDVIGYRDDFSFFSKIVFWAIFLRLSIKGLLYEED